MVGRAIAKYQPAAWCGQQNFNLFSFIRDFEKKHLERNEELYPGEY